MNTYQYRTIVATFSDDHGLVGLKADGENYTNSQYSVADVMNKWGEDGWELMYAVTVKFEPSEQEVTFFFKHIEYG